MLTLLWQKWLNRMSQSAQRGQRISPRKHYRPLELERLEDRLVLSAYIGATDTTPYERIQDAINEAPSTATIYVTPGEYHENLTIDSKNITLLSTKGRDQTKIVGANDGGTQGTIDVEGTTTGVQIGGAGQGFTIVGIDGPAGNEYAAVYFAGNHSNAQVIDNEIVANGDEGLLTIYGATINNFTIASNTFSGQVFAGSTPGGDGFGKQFDEENVPRQLVVIGGGPGGGNTSNITFTNNTITGIAGGYNAEGKEQGNSLVTIDSNGATITGNSFAGTTTRLGSSFRARGPDTIIAGNTFVSSGLTDTAGQVEVYNTGQSLAQVAATNTFDKGVYIDEVSDPIPNDRRTSTIGHAIQPFVNYAKAGTAVHLLDGKYNESVTIAKDLTLAGAGKDTVIQGTGTGTGIAISDPAGFVYLQDLAIQGWATGISASGLSSLSLNNLALTDNTTGGSLDRVFSVNYTPTAATVAANATLTGNSFRNGSDDTVKYSNVTYLSVVGSDKADVFTVIPAPSGGTIISVYGGDPTPPATSGDTLKLNLGGVINPVLISNYYEDSGYRGTWTSQNRQRVEFAGMETLTPSAVLDGGGTPIAGHPFVPLNNVPVAHFTFLNNTRPLGDIRATIRWGDGVSSQGTVEQSGDSYVIRGSHTYTSNGSFTVNVDVTTVDSSATFTTTATIAAASIDNPMPSLASLNPTSSPAGGESFTLTINGSGFIPNSEVRWNGTALATTYVNGNRLTAVVPAADLAAQGVANITVVNPTPGGGISNALTFTVTAPANVLQGDGTPIAGIQFAPLNNVPVAHFTFSNNTRPTGDFDATIRWGDGVSSTGTVVESNGGYVVQGSHTYTSSGSFTVNVDVTIDGSSATFSAPAAIAASTGNPTPALASLSPSSMPASSGSFNLTINGSDFLPGSVVRWNGTALATTYVSSNQLAVVISAADVAAQGTATITVVNPNPGGGTSNALTFTVTAPTSALQGSGTAISGTSNVPFDSLSVAQFTYQDNTRPAGEFSATIHWGDGTSSTGAVVKSEGGYVVLGSHTYTASASFTVTVDVSTAGSSTTFSTMATIAAANPDDNSVPVLTGLSPSSISAGSEAFTLTVNGSGFIPGSVVRWNGTALETTYVSGSQLTAVVPASDVSAVGTANITVVNPAPGGGTSNALTFTVTAPTTVIIDPASGPSDSDTPQSTGAPATASNNFVTNVFNNLLHQPADAATIQVWGQLVDILSASQGALFARFSVALGIVNGWTPFQSLIISTYIAQSENALHSSILATTLFGSGSVFASIEGSPSQRVDAYYELLGLSSDGLSGLHGQILSLGVPDRVVAALIAALHGGQLS